MPQGDRVGAQAIVGAGVLCRVDRRGHEIFFVYVYAA
jgi:hypothetical protein